jgi:hypothetical protein
VLVRSMWRAEVELDPWQPQYETTHRRVATPAETAAQHPDRALRSRDPPRPFRGRRSVTLRGRPEHLIMPPVLCQLVERRWPRRLRPSLKRYQGVVTVALACGDVVGQQLPRSTASGTRPPCRRVQRAWTDILNGPLQGDHPELLCGW